MRTKLQQLRHLMKEQGIDYYLIPSEDDHHSEYVHAYFQCRAWISGFTGSAGTLLVGREAAWLWTDGRYFLQAERQLEGTGIQLMRSGEPGVPDLVTLLSELDEEKKETAVLAYDGRVVSAAMGRAFRKRMKTLSTCDLAGQLWQDRPAIQPEELYVLSDRVTGRPCRDKIRAIRKSMQEKGATALLLTDLTEIAWMLNLRGADIPCTPVFYSFALMDMKHVHLFLMNPAQFRRDLQASYDFVSLHAYQDIGAALASLPAEGTLWWNPAETGDALAARFPPGMHGIEEPSPVAGMKAVKNAVEIACTRKAHLRDGECMVRFLQWVKHAVKEMPVTEIEASDYLDWQRFDAGAMDLSFPTISGYGSHSAIIHYQATGETDAELRQEGFLLVDSGGQYHDGTTDITRTIALGSLSQKMKEYYTYVLKSHIALATAVFPPGTTGEELDRIARAPLQAHGLDFRHGTGHGVGHMLSVHEGPNMISPRGGNCAFVPGMITSNEPGVYLPDEFGIRLENEILCVERDGRYQFETITFCPFERAAILPALLTEQELTWVNHYHKTVRDHLMPRLDHAARTWLNTATAPLSR